MADRHPCIWCTWDKRTGLSKAHWQTRSSANNDKMLRKLCDVYYGDSKNHAINCDGVDDAESFDYWLNEYMKLFNLSELHSLLALVKNYTMKLRGPCQKKKCIDMSCYLKNTS